ncbi:hypothetical protein NMY22_g2357 [Coprinellus aureogranulatus]|nr:hypothetical protein NMY22_g2357 [Coprinellus aureogranulatus]
MSLFPHPPKRRPTSYPRALPGWGDRLGSALNLGVLASHKRNIGRSALLGFWPAHEFGKLLVYSSAKRREVGTVLSKPDLEDGGMGLRSNHPPESRNGERLFNNLVISYGDHVYKFVAAGSAGLGLFLLSSTTITNTPALFRSHIDSTHTIMDNFDYDKTGSWEEIWRTADAAAASNHSRQTAPVEGQRPHSADFVSISDASAIHQHYYGPVNVIGVAHNSNLGVNHVPGFYTEGSELYTILNPVQDASHSRNLKRSPPNSKCLPGTRKDVLEEVRSWAHSKVLPTVPHVLWIFGYAGCGKSAIALEIAKEFSRQNCLAASFFFFQGSENRNTVARFATTIASQVAASIPGVQPILESTVKSNRGLLSTECTSLSEQMELLVYLPIRAVASLLSGPVFIVLDGADECGDREEIAEFIEHTIEFFDRYPSMPLRIVITSRVEDHLHQRLNSSCRVQLLDLVQHTSDEDIAIALDIAIEKEKRSRVFACDPYWPSPFERFLLVRYIGGSYIFMTTILKRLFDSGSKDGLTPMDRLPLVFEMSPDFDSLYTSILSPCQHFAHFQNVVSTIALAYRPLSIVQIADLVGARIADVVNILLRLHAIIQVPGDDHTPVTLWHRSLLDFLRAVDRSGSFYASPLHHHRIAYRALPPGSPASEYLQEFALKHLGDFLSALEETPSLLDQVHPTLSQCLDGSMFYNGQTALEAASREENWQLVRNLVDLGADVNVQFSADDGNIATVLHAACFFQKYDIIYFLLEKGVDPNVSGPRSDMMSDLEEGTPLTFASHRGDVLLVTKLLACGANVNLHGGSYSTALQAACDGGSLEVINLLLQHGADPNLRGGLWGSALHACAWYGRADLARVLLEHKANPNITRPNDAWTPLQQACECGYADVAKCLLEFGASIRNADGTTRGMKE